MVKHTSVPHHHVKTFLTGNAAAMLALVLATSVPMPVSASAGVEGPPTEAASAPLYEIAVDRMALVQEALEEYRRIHGRYPATEDWYLKPNPLEGLLPPTFLFDPWQKPLRYMGVVQDGVVVDYCLETEENGITSPINPKPIRLRPTPVKILVPTAGTRVLVHLENGEALGDARFQVLHRDRGVSVAWFLDGEKIATTQDQHLVTARVGPGGHNLLVVDQSGFSDLVVFRVAKE
jgi:hypothetical protein